MNNQIDELLNKASEGAELLRNRRYELGYSKNDLSRKTRITRSVIDAIEKLQYERLPESAYLKSMLISIENVLLLKRSSLFSILDYQIAQRKYKKKQGFGFRNLDLINTSQGAFIYFLLLITSIFILNRQQIKLAKENSITYKPIDIYFFNSTEKETIGLNSEESGNIIRNLQVNFLKLFKNDNKEHWLILKVQERSSIKISSKNNGITELDDVKGDIRIKLINPVLLKITPPLSNKDIIIWRNKRTLIKGTDNGIYRLDSEFTNSQEKTSDLPQNLDLSP